MAQLKATIVNGTLTVTNTFLSEGAFSVRSGVFKVADSTDNYSLNINITEPPVLTCFYNINGNGKNIFAYAADNKFYVYTDHLYLGFHSIPSYNTLLRFYNSGVWGGGISWATKAVTSDTYITKDVGNWAELNYLNPAQRVNDSGFVNPMFFFRQYSNDGSGNKVNYYETYQLPIVDLNRTANAGYQILTTKNTVSVNQGGTGRTTGGTTSYVRVGNGTNAADNYVSTLRATESTVDIHAGTSGNSSNGPALDFHYGTASAFTARIAQIDANTLRIIFP